MAYNTKCPYSELFSPNAEKYGPEKAPYLDTFHAVQDLMLKQNTIWSFLQWLILIFNS